MIDEEYQSKTARLASYGDTLRQIFLKPVESF
jgi:hypothetical protein